MPQLLKNNVSGVLSAPITAVATTMNLVDASSFPDPGADYYLVTLVGLNGNGQESTWEIVRVTAKASNTLTIVRAQEGTTAASWPAATTVQMRLTAGSVFDIASGGTGATTAAAARTNLGVAIGSNVQAWDADLDAVAGLSTTGLMARTGAGTAAVRTLTGPAAGITVTNGNGVSGNPTLALANDLAGVEGISTTGFVRRTATDTWSASAIVDGDLPSALTGKTYNALTLTAAATGFTVAGGTTSKTLTVSSTLTFTGTDGSTLNIGGGGTLGTGAYATIANYATLASPTFTGTPAAPTAAVDTNTTQLATTAYVVGQGYAKLASPTFTGTPAAPTAAVDTNTTQIASTAYVVSQGYLKSATAATTYQPLDADLTAIAALAGTSGFLKKTAADTWSLDTSTYLTGNQSISISGDASGSGATSISLTLASSGVAAGTYNDSATAVRPFTVDAKGRVTGIGTAVTIAPAFSSVTSKPTTISGYGITDAYTKTEVDTLVTGLDFKASVRAATTANITLSGTQTIDGVAVVANDRVLVKNQSTGSQNGIYVVAAGAWARAADANVSAEVTPGMYVFVEEGTTNADSGWVLTTDAPITLDTTALTFTQFNGLGQVTAGAGLTKTGNTLDVATASSARIVVNADSIDLATTGVSAGTFRSVTVDTYGRVTSASNPTLGIADGGTGATTAVAAFDALSPATTLGDLIYSNGTDNVRLAGNTLAARRFLRQTGTGTVSAAPAWDALADSDVPSALTGKTYNGLTLTAATTGFTVAGGTTSKTLTVGNTLTLSGTDGSTLNIGAGGTLGTGAYATIANYAPLASPTFTGTPAAPTATAGTNTTQIATTAFVNAEIAADAAPLAHVGSTGAAHGNATTSAAGFMSAADKTKLDGVATGATANTGTVTSVALSLPAEFTVTGSPVTGSGTLTATKANQTANTFFAAPNGSTGAPTFRAIVAADIPTLNQSTTGNAATATALQTTRLINGASFNGTANVETSEWIHSDRDFPNGTLITTSINYGVTDGDPFILEIRGNSYGSIVPFDIQYQGYIYSNTIISHGGYAVGTNITGLVALNVGGNLCFWFPSQTYWHGYSVRAYTAYSGRPYNRVTSITGVAKPSGTKEVALSENIRQVLRSDNYNNYAPTLTGGGASGTWAINITGSAASATSATSATNASNVNLLTSSANGSYPIVWAGSQSAGNQQLYIDASGGTYNPSSNTADINILGNAATATNASNAWAVGSDTTTKTNSLQYWQLSGDSALNPDTNWWYAIRMSHGDADSYYSATLATRFDTDDIKFRRKVNGAFQSWRTILHEGNYTSYSPSLTGAGASGNWGISVTGNAATVTNGVYTNNGQRISGTKQFDSSNSAMATSTGGLAAVEAYGTGGAAFMGFHRPNEYAAYFGLDSDNVWKVGGWSMGAAAYPVYHGGLSRLPGDFSNGTLVSRTLFRSSTTNGETSVGAIPNGTGTTASFALFNNSTPTNSAYASLAISATKTQVVSAQVGTGTALPLALTIAGTDRVTFTTGGRMQVDAAQDANIVAVAALSIDCAAGNYFTKTISANSTFTVSNVPASRAYAFTLELTHTSGTVTWFSGVQWPGGTAPTLTTGKVHLFTFVTDDGGTSWRGASQVNYNS